MQGFQGRSLEEVEAQTRIAVDAVAPIIKELDEGLIDPCEDLELFFRYLPGRRMLDAGCGTARYAKRFIDHGLEYVGIDLSPKMIELARSGNPRQRFEVMSFRNLKFPNASFDGIWCCCALGHEVKSYVPHVLGEMRRVLKPGGVLSLMLPDIGDSEEFVGRIHRMVDVEGYCAYYDLNELAEKVRVAGFSILQGAPRVFDGAMSIHARK